MSKRRDEYYKYLESSHWKKLRLEAFKRDGYKCVKCGSPWSLRGHHKRYRKDIRSCTVSDIETLCNRCHEKHHKRIAKLRKRHRRMRLITILCRFSADP